MPFNPGLLTQNLGQAFAIQQPQERESTSSMVSQRSSEDPTAGLQQQILRERLSQEQMQTAAQKIKLPQEIETAKQEYINKTLDGSNKNFELAQKNLGVGARVGLMALNNPDDAEAYRQMAKQATGIDFGNLRDRKNVLAIVAASDAYQKELPTKEFQSSIGNYGAAQNQGYADAAQTSANLDGLRAQAAEKFQAGDYAGAKILMDKIKQSTGIPGVAPIDTIAKAEETKAAIDGWRADVTDLRDAAKGYEDRNIKYNALEKSLGTIVTGPGETSKAKIRTAAAALNNALGLEIPLDTDKLDAAKIIDAVGTDQWLALSGKLKGSIQEQENARLEKGIINLAAPPVAAKFMLQMARWNNEFDKKKYDFYKSYKDDKALVEDAWQASPEYRSIQAKGQDIYDNFASTITPKSQPRPKVPVGAVFYDAQGNKHTMGPDGKPVRAE